MPDPTPPVTPTKEKEPNAGVTLKLGYHFTQAKGDRRWHIVPNGLIGSVCGGTPRGGHALELSQSAENICRKCADQAGSIIKGYVRRCLVCREPLSEELPYNITICLDCSVKRASKRAIYHTSGGRSHQGFTTRRGRL